MIDLNIFFYFDYNTLKNLFFTNFNKVFFSSYIKYFFFFSKIYRTFLLSNEVMRYVNYVDIIKICQKIIFLFIFNKVVLYLYNFTYFYFYMKILSMKIIHINTHYKLNISEIAR